MGAGRAGSLLATSLDQDGHEVTIIDTEPAAFNRLPDTFGGETVVGNAMDVDILRRAGIEGADAFVAATSGDNRNILAGQIAKVVFHVPRVVTRIKDPYRATLYRSLGLEVDCRTTRGAEHVMELVAAED